MDLSPRKLRYFVAVADELHFGRAASKLYIAQQSLSAQIRELEDEVGCQRLHRTTRKVELTAAGEVFLPAARKSLAVADQGVEDARRVALKAGASATPGLHRPL
ncbi:LysR family transcriptional regulator [Streptomyces sp. SID13031]|uniref:LysR family transcriptional regulator n=1 Tax=Streptomyces sp. SID13031 TaxID=2706046 RepID=UPI0031BA0E83